MMNDKNINQQNLELYQKKIMMMGGHIDNQIKLTPEQIKQLKKDYSMMFIGLTSINWSKGVTLGSAWQKALEQMDGFIAAKTKIANHPINKYLIEHHKMFRAEMAKHIMECRGKESDAKLTPRLLKTFEQDGIKMLQDGKGKLNDWYAKYMPKQTLEKHQDIKKFEDAKQKAIQLMQQVVLMQHQKVA